MTIAEILKAAGGIWEGDESLLSETPVNIVTDSRAAGPGSLFLAIRGEKTDGHFYIPDVLSKGALAVLCEEPSGKGEPRIVADSTIEAMQRAASFHRQQLGIPFVGVTGSVGKTTAKEMISAALSGGKRVYKTPGSLNGQIGLPVSLMSMPDEYDAAVIEMGISLFGEMTRLTQIVHPDMAVFTNIGDAHLEFLHNREGVLQAKSEILKGMRPGSAVIVNGDDAHLSEAPFEGFRKITFGLNPDCDFRAENIRSGDGTSFCCDIVTPEGRYPVEVPAYGNYIVYSILAAAAVAKEAGLTSNQIQAGLKNYQTLSHRSRVIRTEKYTIVDDCYNANPTSDKSAIESLQNIPGRKVCILGDMRELGEVSAEAHAGVGRFAVENGVALVLTQGEEAKYIAGGAGDAARHFETKAELIAALPHLLQPGDVILVKASHGARFEEIEEVLETL